MYIGLLNGSTEPDISTGYTRVKGNWSRPAFFDTPNGIGVITHVALFEDIVGGEPIEVVKLFEPVDCRAGVIPVVNGGRLIPAHGAGMSANLTVSAYGISY